VTERGNFEDGTTVLTDRLRAPRERFAAARATLRGVRETRIAPGTDRKRVTSWNALTVSGIARAASLLGDETALAEAAAAADFLDAKLRDRDGRLLRVWNEGRAHVTGFLDDHATLLEASLDLHRAGAGERFLSRALALADALVRRFYEDADRDFYLTPNDGEALAQRPRSDHDGATPHSTGLAALGLLRAASIAGRNDLRDVARAVLRTHATALERAPEAFPTLARAALVAERGASLALVIGSEDDATRALAARARRVLAPVDAVVVAKPGAAPTDVDPSWLVGREPIDGRATAYVCRGTVCSLPITDPGALTPLLRAPPEQESP
jgi:uncharacterized protein YyaL (SSP411 family)